MMAITLDDCKEILSKANLSYDEDDVRYKLKPLGEKTRGYLGEHSILSITSKNTTTEFFVKTQPTTELVACFENFFEKEVFAYQFFHLVKQKCSEVDISFLPKYYHHNKAGTLVLENLEKEGFRGCDELMLGEDNVVLVLKMLAKLHAASFKFADYNKELKSDYDLSQEYRFGPLFLRDNTVTFNYISAGSRGAAHLVTLAGRDEDAKKLILDYTQTFFDLISGKNDFVKIFCHGDLWSFNLLFKEEGGEAVDCRIIDYQLINYAPPAVDITMAIYHCGDPKVHKSTNKLYKVYYDFLTCETLKLGLNIRNIFSYDELMKSCRIFMLWSKYLWMLYRQSSQAKDQVWKDLAKTPEKSREIIMGNLREQFVEENFRGNQNYREVLTRILDDNILTLKNPLINIEDLYEVIGKTIKTNNFQILDVKLTELSERGGYLGEHFTLDVKISSCNSNITTKNFFIKFAPFNKSSREYSDATGACKKEVNFFSVLLPIFKKFNLPVQEVVPKVFFGIDDYIIFENLDRKNYKVQNPRFCMGYDKMKAALRNLAKLHASAIILERKYYLKGRLNEVFPVELREMFYTELEASKKLVEAHVTSLDLLISTFSNYSSLITKEEFYEIARRIILDYPNLVKPSSTYINTICHGDLWGNNLMFNDENDCIIIDFQSYRYRPPTHDLMQMIYLTTDIKERDKYMQDYLEYYYKEFGKIFNDHDLEVKDFFSFGDFLDSCKEEEIFAVAQTLTHFQSILFTKENKELIFESDESYDKFFFGDLRAYYLKKAFENDELQRLKLEEAVRDFRRICEDNKDRYL